MKRTSMQMRMLYGVGVGLVIVSALRGLAADDTIAERLLVERLRRDVTYLASAECEGRGVQTEGINKAADYIAAEFKKAGLKPPAHCESYFQPFSMMLGAELGSPNMVRLRGPEGQEIELAVGKDFQVMGLSGSGKVSAPLVFAGFGATAPGIGYDDYQDLDVAGKVVLALRHTPRWRDPKQPFDGTRKEEHASLERKQALAESNKAAAFMFVNDLSEVPAGDKLTPFDYLRGAMAYGQIPSLHVRRAAVEAAIQSGLGKTLQEIEDAIDKDLKPHSGMLMGWTATIETNVLRKMLGVKNVVGVAEGRGALANETVVIGAHYDHLGYGGKGSRAKNPNNKEIHHGADDNASGTTALLELARRFANIAEKAESRRRLVFIAFSAEESGLLGSRYYCTKEPLYPLDKTIAMVNLDMVGRMHVDSEMPNGKLIVEGVGTAKGFDSMIDRLNGPMGMKLVKQAGGTGPSDHDSFYRQKIPVLFFWTGTHEDYHRPSDTAEKINLAGLKKITDLAERTITELSTLTPRPEYVYVPSTFAPGMGKGPRLGIMPNYESGKPGVQVAGLSEGGPAAAGGIKVGDLIVQIAGKAVTNINTYMAVMSQQRGGQAVEIDVIRDGKKVTLKVVPK